MKISSKQLRNLCVEYCNDAPMNDARLEVLQWLLEEMGLAEFRENLAQEKTADVNGMEVHTDVE